MIGFTVVGTVWDRTHHLLLTLNPKKIQIFMLQKNNPLITLTMIFKTYPGVKYTIKKKLS